MFTAKRPPARWFIPLPTTLQNMIEQLSDIC